MIDSKSWINILSKQRNENKRNATSPSESALEIIGTDQVEGVRVANIDSKGNVINGSEKIYEADFVCIAGDYTHLPNLRL